ncbi:MULTISPECIES: DUF3159 domain-containing protein [unclassified Streptomyces]|uniref:DUF3159 domain-containing protein n=1 Tax=unclassified Streptomyces TaxID=2593676 RepID=UPI002DDB7D9B|nr:MULTISPECIES: DUF3159 domain-containing protein [unclassified Streptomyces]WSA91693.1 DUF3159 domain-containing protein [Streptomyces sp. NBC_01795]WSB76067.1 DUF3159 domain-containing protein [Streptomyces sp. NBC_01775]WSS15660.1 DUF3159 domain-containing protein [Streptomyces sp. NBC_01186]WSS44502.1 DUF3159 domain-containing protein [Streptomyces sp. NBC_01187]
MKTKSFLETESDTQAEQAAPRKRPSALDQAGGVRGVIYSALPVLAFVIAHNFRGLKASIIAAFAVAVAIGVERLVRRESVQPAVGGVFGVAIAAGVVWFTGSAKDYFLIGIWASLAGAILFLLSVLVRWPLAGVVWNAATGKGTVWRADKRSRLYYDVATLVLAAVFGARFVVQQYFYETDQVSSLGFAKVAMGFPLLALALLVVAWAARHSNKRLTAIGLLPARRV